MPQRPESGPIKINGFSTESKKIIRQLEEYEWTFTLSTNGHAIGLAPDGITRTSVSKNLSRANRSQQAADVTVKRWEKHMTAMQALADAEVTDRARNEGYDPVLSPILKEGMRKHVHGAGTALGEAALTEVSEPVSRVTEVSRAPWLARQGSHRKSGTTSLYESGAVVEVTWSNGTLTYACSLSTCDYASENPRSVSSHFRGHVRAGEHEPVGQLSRPSVAKDVPVSDFRDDYHRKQYTPSERLLRALEHYLASVGSTDITALAYAALQWYHERPDLEDVEARSHEPLDDGQILAKIRLLVGGRDVELEEAHRHTLTTLEVMKQEHEDAMLAVEGRLEEAQAKATALQENIDTWLSLAPYPRPPE